ncbi:MAG: hypothetical protein LBE82_00245 [Chitinophagaceae bacterium]|jgi:hypothetical protein|nr:hypothetical protein [Chitinophagaceae bacterium]
MQEISTIKFLKTALERDENYFVYDSYDAIFSPDSFDLYSFETNEEAQQFLTDNHSDASSSLTYSYAKNVSTFLQQIEKYRNDYYGRTETKNLNDKDFSSQLNSNQPDNSETTLPKTHLDETLTTIEFPENLNNKKDIQQLLQAAFNNKEFHFVYDSYDAAFSPDNFELLTFKTKEDADHFLLHCSEEIPTGLTYTYAKNISTFLKQTEENRYAYLSGTDTKKLNDKNNFSQLNTTKMEATNATPEQSPTGKNISYLEKQLEFLGFGEEAKDLFLTAMPDNKENENFDISFNHSFATPLSKKDEPDTRREVTYTLHYNKDKKEGRDNTFFFLNSYEIADKKHQMKMYVSSDRERTNYTMKEAFNLLEGRSVYKKDLTSKEGEKYNAWISFDFNHLNEKNQPSVYRYTDKYGYNVSEALKTLSLKENKYQDRHNQLIDSLRKGNLQAVTAIVEGKEKQLFIEANPQYKNFNLYEINEKNRLVTVKPDAYKVIEAAPENTESVNAKTESNEAEAKENAKLENQETGNAVNENQGVEMQQEQQEEQKETRRSRRGR